ncbi:MULTISPECIES: hypothetical protein [Paenibacillus]|uniref:DUF5673 domain-containing protein n=2 Tax=Paenibacillus TaxID=44249 RepID=A0ABX2ZEY1_PAEPO|nr:MULTISPECIES: hypothetical protein [Paenibacillus]MDR6777942.1 hypothetical protein [Paenibacillus peoriae]ODA08843.1 hypothetical protein A7312_05415 [Paenibacillus polymyxa]OME75458.1 hypothetical protein BK119_02480 [Paenibacillus peoriae]OMF23808.1 hypothetical protein BK134_26660 [Paenibacillus peoriae]
MEVITKYLPIVGAGSLVALALLIFKAIALINSSTLEKLLYKSNKRYMVTPLSIALTVATTSMLCVIISFLNDEIKTITDLKVTILASSFLSFLLSLIVFVPLYFTRKKKGRVYYIKDNLNGTDIELYLLKTTDEGYILLSDQPHVKSSTGFKILRKQEDILNRQIYSKLIS